MSPDVQHHRLGRGAACPCHQAARVFAADHPLGQGKALLHVTWKATMDKVRSRAVYQVAEGTDWYAYTFFEPIDARRAFPGAMPPRLAIACLRAPDRMPVLPADP